MDNVLINVTYSGDYWLNSVSTYDPHEAFNFSFDAADVYTDQSYRHYGFSIRSVLI